MTASVNTYQPGKTYVLAKVETAWGTAVTPAGATDGIGIVRSFTPNPVNNKKRLDGMGAGLNAKSSMYGQFGLTGSVEFLLNKMSVLVWGFGGYMQGSGGVADPYEVVETDIMGYGATECPSITFEVGKVHGTNDDVDVYDGVCINTMTITASFGEAVVVNWDWIARNMTTSTTAETYTQPTDAVVTFVDGAVTIGSDTVSQVSSFVITVARNLSSYGSLGSRFINLPVAGLRRYDFSLTLKHTYNSTASYLSGNEMKGLFYNGSTGTTAEDIPIPTAVGTISLDITEGAAATDRVINFDFENAQIETVSSPVDIGGGVVEMTVTGYALAGLTDTAKNIPCRWYTIV